MLGNLAENTPSFQKGVGGSCSGEQIAPRGEEERWTIRPRTSPLALQSRVLMPLALELILIGRTLDVCRDWSHPVLSPVSGQGS